MLVLTRCWPYEIISYVHFMKVKEKCLNIIIYIGFHLIVYPFSRICTSSQLHKWWDGIYFAFTLIINSKYCIFITIRDFKTTSYTKPKDLQPNIVLICHIKIGNVHAILIMYDYFGIFHLRNILSSTINKLFLERKY